MQIRESLDKQARPKIFPIITHSYTHRKKINLSLPKTFHSTFSIQVILILKNYIQYTHILCFPSSFFYEMPLRGH